MTKPILFLTPYPYSTAPSQRFRFEQYYSALQQQGIQYKEASFLDDRTWKILYHPGKTIAKALGIIKGFFRRFLLLFTLSKFDYIFIHREATPIGPPIFEWIIAKVLKKKIIYDFDDAIWIPNTSEQNKIAAVVKWHHKVSSIIKWSYKVSVGNAYLAEYARQYNPNVIINPTTIDTEGVHNLIKEYTTPNNPNREVPNQPPVAYKEDIRQEPPLDVQNQEVPIQTPFEQSPPLGGWPACREAGGVKSLPLNVPNTESPNQTSFEQSPPLGGKGGNTDPKTIIGWTGSHSTLPYINEIIPVLQRLEQEYPIEFQVISNQDPQLHLHHYRFVKWNKKTEIEDLVKFDIGLMPLTEDKWAKGKCGFKALQYMALGIPPLVSPVGVNTEIVTHGQNGYICSTETDWHQYIVKLIESPALRSQLGTAARQTVVEKYSVKSNTGNFLGLFR